MNRITLTILFSIITFSSFGQSVCEKLEELKKDCYGFKPTSLTDTQQKVKSVQLDKFWNYAQAHTEESAECLKNMIVKEENDPYFCFDASSLLLQIDKKERYLDIVLKGLQKCNLEDLQLEPFLRVSFFLGMKGKDISSLTEKLISHPNAKVFLTMHVITLSAIDASLFLYNTMTTEKAEKSLFNSILQGNATAKHNAAVVLNLISTQKGDSLLNVLTNTNQLADSTIKFIQNDRKVFINRSICNSSLSKDDVLQHLKNYPPQIGEGGFASSSDLMCAAINQLSANDVKLLRQVRQKSIRGLSDEALHEYLSLTAIIMTVRNK